ncbi:MAG: NCS2 family permease, partial [Acidimicrobiia bacterium]|nr:NCS2 family permease [Acidimicrobiia bacterium]
AMIIAPIAGIIPAQATAPVLIFVGFLMTGLLKGIDFEDVEEGLPALLTMILMPLTYSITVGIGAGFVTHVVVKVFRGKTREIPILMWIVAASFLVYFAQELLGGVAA